MPIRNVSRLLRKSRLSSFELSQLTLAVVFAMTLPLFSHDFVAWRFIVAHLMLAFGSISVRAIRRVFW